VAYTTEYGCDTTEQSSLNLVYLLGFQPESSGFSILGESDERYEVVGGAEQLPNAMADSLPSGSVRLNWRLAAIAQDDDQVTLTFTTPDGERRETFDRSSSPSPSACCAPWTTATLGLQT
jgi:monoamine oxidase